jgi:hypothetical protein
MVIATVGTGVGCLPTGCYASHIVDHRSHCNDEMLDFMFTSQSQLLIVHARSTGTNDRLVLQSLVLADLLRDSIIYRSISASSEIERRRSRLALSPTIVRLNTPGGSDEGKQEGKCYFQTSETSLFVSRFFFGVIFSKIECLSEALEKLILSFISLDSLLMRFLGRNNPAIL